MPSALLHAFTAWYSLCDLRRGQRYHRRSVPTQRCPEGTSGKYQTCAVSDCIVEVRREGRPERTFARRFVAQNRLGLAHRSRRDTDAESKEWLSAPLDIVEHLQHPALPLKAVRRFSQDFIIRFRNSRIRCRDSTQLCAHGIARLIN